MELSEYFESTKGIGILATSDSQGGVNQAIYARPHVVDDDTIVLIMANRLSYSNLKSNPQASYLYIENGDGYKGKRLYLEMIREDNAPELVESLRRRKRKDGHCDDDGAGSSAVYFKINNVRPLIGG